MPAHPAVTPHGGDNSAHEAQRAAEATSPPPAAAAIGASPAATDRFHDADLDGLALKLDAHSRQLRADLLAHMADCQRRAAERHREAVAAVASSTARELAATEQVGLRQKSVARFPCSKNAEARSKQSRCCSKAGVTAARCIARPLRRSVQQTVARHPNHRSWPAHLLSWSGSGRSCGARAARFSRRHAGGGSTHWAAWRGGRGASRRPGVVQLGGASALPCRSID